MECTGSVSNLQDLDVCVSAGWMWRGNGTDSLCGCRKSYEFVDLAESGRDLRISRFLAAARASHVRYLHNATGMSVEMREEHVRNSVARSKIDMNDQIFTYD